MRQLLKVSVFALAAACAAPAAAQVYPNRIVARQAEPAKAKDKDKPRGAYQRHDDDREEATDRVVKTSRIGGSGTVDLQNIAGDITITRGGGSDATIEIIRTARARSSDDAHRMLNEVTVDVAERPGRVEVRAHYPQNTMFGGFGAHRGANVTTTYNVAAPAGTRVVIETISGDVKISDIKGEVNASTMSGDIRIASPARLGTIKTVSGTVEITDAQVDSAIEAASVSGDVIIRHARSRSIQAGSVSGNVRIEDADCDRISAHTIAGNLSYAGALSHNGRYELKGFSGDVRVAVPSNSGFELHASSFSGDIRTEIPLTTRGTTDHGHHRSLTGTYGDGSAVLDVTTFSGQIVITKR